MRIKDLIDCSDAKSSARPYRGPIPPEIAHRCVSYTVQLQQRSGSSHDRRYQGNSDPSIPGRYLTPGSSPCAVRSAPLQIPQQVSPQANHASPTTYPGQQQSNIAQGWACRSPYPPPPPPPPTPAPVVPLPAPYLGPQQAKIPQGFAFGNTCPPQAPLLSTPASAVPIPVSFKVIKQRGKVGNNRAQRQPRNSPPQISKTRSTSAPSESKAKKIPNADRQAIDRLTRQEKLKVAEDLLVSGGYIGWQTKRQIGKGNEKDTNRKQSEASILDGCIEFCKIVNRLKLTVDMTDERVVRKLGDVASAALQQQVSMGVPRANKDDMR
ncbi:Hypothetical protein D9617_12g035320 [Elsinoe fawcettii]|nr:Hypothetical protein D9617_12g035320 [Elsinoe fawcettii]